MHLKPSRGRPSLAHDFGRLAHSVRLSPWVLRTIQTCYSYNLQPGPPVISGVIELIVLGDSVQLLRDEISSLLMKGAVRDVPMEEVEAGFYSRYFVVPKRGGGSRPILDLRALNKCLSNADSESVVTINASKRALHNSRSQRRLFSYFDIPSTQEISKVCLQRKSLRVCCSTVRAQPGSSNVYEGGRSGAHPPERERHENNELHGRSSDSVRLTGSSVGEYGYDGSPPSKVGILYKCSKKHTCPVLLVMFLGLRLNSLSFRAYVGEHRAKAFRSYLALFHLGHKGDKVCLKLLGLMVSMIAVIPLGLLYMIEFQRWVFSLGLDAYRCMHRNRQVVVSPSFMGAPLIWKRAALLTEVAVHT